MWQCLQTLELIEGQSVCLGGILQDFIDQLESPFLIVPSNLPMTKQCYWSMDCAATSRQQRRSTAQSGCRQVS